MNDLNKIFIRDYQLDVAVGVHPHEKGRLQPLIINATVFLSASIRWVKDDIRETVSYDGLLKRIEKVTQAAHHDLLETIAEKIAASFFEIEKIEAVEVRVEKPAIFKDTKSAGIEIKRIRSK